ncbi:cell envelope integrity EipB family protein [Nitratireductor luteus]|uniref:cell envelope integrity EipB family protein n=1 Tax=Nitratireductor luteus TaxID=2976980 RepID=UPI00223FD752|nr:cell envelope integrity EipB family protein [Nitratireductor luteus]
MRLPRLAIALLAPVCTFFVPLDVQARELQAHRAVYNLALADTNDDSEIESLSGRWVFEFSGSKCSGYALKSRIVMRIGMSEGERLIDQQVTSFEDADSQTFRFVTKSFIDEELESEVKGTAKLDDEGTTVAYEQPEKVEQSFETTLFPSAFLNRLLDNAEKGESFFQSPIFDGTEFTDSAIMTSVVVGKPKPVEENDPEAEALGELSEDEFMAVTAAYFDGEKSGGEEVSDYIVSFKLHENGVQRDMLIRYDEYSMTAKLADLTLFDTDDSCPAQ